MVDFTKIFNILDKLNEFVQDSGNMQLAQKIAEVREDIKALKEREEQQLPSKKQSQIDESESLETALKRDGPPEAFYSNRNPDASPFCPYCWKANQDVIALNRFPPQEKSKGIYHCPQCSKIFG